MEPPKLTGDRAKAHRGVIAGRPVAERINFAVRDAEAFQNLINAGGVLQRMMGLL
jgi:hypothetical protein